MTKKIKLSVVPMSKGRLDWLEKSIMFADDSSAGQYTKKQATAEIINYAETLIAFANLTPGTQVAEYCLEFANSLLRAYGEADDQES